MLNLQSHLTIYKEKNRRQAKDQNNIRLKLNQFLFNEFANSENIIRSIRFKDDVFTIQTTNKIYASELFFRRDKIQNLLKELNIKTKRIVIN